MDAKGLLKLQKMATVCWEDLKILIYKSFLSKYVQMLKNVDVYNK